jgi:hypothetical protein
MNTPEFRARLQKLSTSQIKALAVKAGVGERTLWKLRSGKTLTVSESVKGRVLSAGFPRAKVAA